MSDLQGRTRRMEPAALVIGRVLVFWQKIGKAWRMTLDWTVLLYILVPALWIGGGIYRDVWLHPPAVFAEVPSVVPAIILLLFMLRGRLRTYADPGDGLFLRSQALWTRRMTLAGLLYTGAARFLLAFTLMGLLLPLAIPQLDMHGTDCVLLALSTAVIGFLWTLVRDRLERRWIGWRRMAVSVVIRMVWMAGSVPTLAWAMHAGRGGFLSIIVVGLLAAVPLVLLRVRASGALSHEISVEKDAYTACVGWILREAGAISVPPATKKPLLFAKSGKLFRRRDVYHRVAELWLRTLLRNMSLMRSIAYLAALGVAAVWLSPLWLAILAWFAMSLLFFVWLHGQWGQWQTERYISLFEWDDKLLQRAEEQGRLAICTPLFLLWGAAIGIHLGIMNGDLWWLAVPIVPTAGWALLQRMNEKLTFYLVLRQQKRAVEDTRQVEGEGTSL